MGLYLIPESWGSPVVEFNRCHNPEGPGGGRFCSEPGGIGTPNQPGVQVTGKRSTVPEAQGVIDKHAGVISKLREFSFGGRAPTGDVETLAVFDGSGGTVSLGENPLLGELEAITGPPPGFEAVGEVVLGDKGDRDRYISLIKDAQKDGIVVGDENSVQPPQPFNVVEKWVAHTHPTGGPPSIADLEMHLSNGAKGMVIVSRDPERWYAVQFLQSGMRSRGYPTEKAQRVINRFYELHDLAATQFQEDFSRVIIKKLKYETEERDGALYFRTRPSGAWLIANPVNLSPLAHTNAKVFGGTKKLSELKNKTYLPHGDWAWRQLAKEYPDFLRYESWLQNPRRRARKRSQPSPS